MKHKPAQSGSVLFIILIAVALFAALSYVFLKGSSGNVSQLTDHQARIAAQEIIAYGNTMVDTVQKLKLRGCTDTNIGFENSVFVHNNGALSSDGSAYPSTPPDGGCSVFNINGGKANPVVMTSAQISLPNVGGARSGHSYFLKASVPDVGTSAPELVLSIAHINKETCYAINKILGVGTENKAPRSIYIGHLYDNSYSGWGTYDNSLSGMTEACYSDTCCDDQDPNFFQYYKVLIAR